MEESRFEYLTNKLKVSEKRLKDFEDRIHCFKDDEMQENAIIGIKLTIEKIKKEIEEEDEKVREYFKS